VFSPDGRQILTGYRDVKVWDVATGQEVLSLPLGLDARQEASRVQITVAALEFSRDGHQLFAALHDGTVRYWDATPVAGRDQNEAMNKP
jgi:WD40 repeat protein